MFQEGLRIPPVRLTDEVRAMLLANTRTPWERRGDLDAQIGANRVGAARLAAARIGRRGIGEATGSTLDAVLDYGERRMRAALAAVPDGTWRFADVVDSTGAAPDQQAPARVQVAVTVAGDTIRFDFDGTAGSGRAT